MAKVLPTQVYPNYQVAAGGAAITPAEDSILIPISDLPSLTPEEADADTGNASEVVRAFVHAAIANLGALPAAEKPTKWSATVTEPVPLELDPALGYYEYQMNYVVTITFPAGGSDATVSEDA